MKGNILVLMILHAAITRLDAQDAGTGSKVPDVDRILERYTIALGGEINARKIRSIHIKGSLEVVNAGIAGTTEIFRKSPDKLLVNLSLPGIGVIRSGFDGKSGWRQSPLAGIIDLQGPSLQELRRRSTLMRDFTLRQLFARVTLEGNEKSAAGESWVVAAVPSEGRSERWYFDSQSGLLSRVDGYSEEELPLETDLEDYRDVNGIKYPFTVKQISPVYQMITRIQDIRINVPLDDAIFQKP